jgi:hypothetical protein
MRQGNGTDLLGMNDPRSATIGVIYVSPNDDRTSVLAAILTQEKLNREHIVIVLPDSNKAFERPQDFDDLKTVQRSKVKGDLIFIAPDGSAAAENARQRHFPVYSSLENYTEALREDGGIETAKAGPEKRGRIFGGGRKSPTTTGIAALGGAALGAAAARNLDNGMTQQPAFRADPQTRLPSSSNPDTPLPQRSLSTQPPVGPHTPNRGILDDDDDALDAPSGSPGNRGGTGSRGGYVPAGGKFGQRGRPTPLAGLPVDEDDDDDWVPPDAGVGAGAGGAGAAGAGGAGAAGAGAVGAKTSYAPTAPKGAGGVPSTPLKNHPNAAPVDDDDDAVGPGIIDLQPATRPGRIRSTLKLPEAPAGARSSQPLDANATTPPTRKRRTGSMATAAAGGAIAGAAVGAAVAPHAVSTGTGAAAAQGRPVAGALPLRGNRPPNRNRNTTANGRGRTRRWIVPLIILLLLTLLLSTAVFAAVNPTAFNSVIGSRVASVLPSAGSPATIAITPASKTVSNNFVVQAVTQNPDPTKLQVSMRTVTANPAAQTRTVNGTGQGQIAATRAHGSITFFNPNSVEEDIGAGTVFTVNGVRIATDSLAPVPPAQLPVTGQFTVSAHAVTGGTAGNIPAGAISGSCCIAGIQAKNQDAFTGGQDPVAYKYVSQADVDAVVNPLVGTLSQEAQTDFTKQLRSNEKLAGPPNCTHNTDEPTSKIGPQGATINSVQVTVSATCTGIAYDYQGAQQVTQQRLQSQAIKDLGANYKLVGDVIPSIQKVNRVGQNVTMLTTAQGIWVYQFSDSQLSQLKQGLVGKKIAQARTILSQLTGIKNFDIKFDKGDTLPSDPGQIKINMNQVMGLSSGSGNNGNPPMSQPGSSGATPGAVTGRGMILPLGQQAETSVKG